MCGAAEGLVTFPRTPPSLFNFIHLNKYLLNVLPSSVRYQPNVDGVLEGEEEGVGRKRGRPTLRRRMGGDLYKQ